MVELTNSFGKSIFFNDESHVYFDADGNNYKSVTTLIHSLFPPFDRDHVAQKCSENVNHEYYGVDPEEIKILWGEKANNASKFGTLVHNYAEQVFLNETISKVIKPKTEREKNYFKLVDMFVQAFLQEYEIVAVEDTVFSKEYLISGTIDLVARHKTSKIIYILDWKTNKQMVASNQWSRSTFRPLLHVDDCNFNHYSLQLNMYKRLRILNGEKAEYKMGLIHLNDGDNPIKLYSVTNMDEEIDAILDKVRKEKMEIF